MNVLCLMMIHNTVHTVFIVLYCNNPVCLVCLKYSLHLSLIPYRTVTCVFEESSTGLIRFHAHELGRRERQNPFVGFSFRQ